MTAITDPTALEDQHQAAERGAGNVLADFAAFTGGTVGQVATSPWLAAQIRGIYTALAAGEAAVCEHVAAGPCAMLACLWKPDTVVCDQCAPALLVVACAAADSCDRCHAEGVPIHSTALSTGPLVLVYGLCEPCQDHPARPTRRRHRPRC